MSDWRDSFKSYSLRTNFQIGLTRPQLEMLCAIADDAEWDRFQLGGINNPSNWIASETALQKRGLIQRKKQERSHKWQNVYEITSTCELTPAGQCLVELLKLTGVFIECDNSTLRKANEKTSRSKR